MCMTWKMSCPMPLGCNALVMSWSVIAITEKRKQEIKLKVTSPIIILLPLANYGGRRTTEIKQDGVYMCLH